MRKITPRSFLLLLICGLVFNSGITAFANINYGPEKPELKEKQQKNLFFVGFYLDEAPTITAPANKSVNSDSGQCYTSISNISLGSPQTTGGGDVNNDAPNQFPIGSTTVTWTITNQDGTDSDTQIITVTDNEQPVITHNGDQNLNTDSGTCGASFTASASATDNCSVGNPTGTRSDGLALTAAYPVGTTTVTWSVTDANNNNAAPVTQTIIITDNEKPVITHNGDQNLNTDSGTCGASFTASASATDNCSVGSPTGLRSDGLALTAAYPVGTTTITWNVTDTNNNNAAPVTQTITVTDNEQPVITHNGDQNLNTDSGTCGASFTASASATDNCSVGNPTGTRSDGLALTAAYPVGTTTVTWSVTDANNNNAASATQTIIVTDNEKPVLPTVNNITWGCEYIVAAPVAVDNCEGEITGEPNRSTTFTESGIIIWTFTDASGNSDSLEQTININPLVAEIETTNISCFGFDNGSAIVTANGGVGNLIYDWGSLAGTGNSKDNLAPGNYIVTVSDQNGCSIELPFIISQPDNLQMTTNPTSTPVSCFGGNDGSITAGTITGGTPDQNGNYQYSIDNQNWNNTGQFTNVEAGTHTIFVVDANACALQVTINVEEPAVLNASLNKTDVNCHQGSDGSIFLSNLSGGSGNYEFSVDGTNWTASSQSIEGLIQGSYEVQIRDTATPDCIIVLNDAYTINQPDAPLEVSVDATRTTTYGSSTASATANPTGGTAGYTYEWRKQNESQILFTTKTINNVAAGNYTVTIKDSKGCTTTKDFKINDAISAEIIPTSICESDESIIRTSFFEIEDLTAIGGVGPYTYSWDFGEGASLTTASTPGPHRVTYSSTGDKNISVTVTDAEGVSSTFNYLQYVGECYRDNCGSNDFTNTEFFVGDAQGNRVTDVTCLLPDQKYIYIEVPSGPERYSLYVEINYTVKNFNTGATTTRQVGDCFYSKQVVPNTAQTFPIDWSCGDEIIVDNIYFTFTNNIKWDCGQGPNPKCFSTNTGELVNAPLFARADPNTILCNGSENGEIEVTASGGFFPYDYSITSADNGFQGENIFNNLTAGNYTVWVRDSENRIFSIENVIIEEPDDALNLEITQPTITCFGETTNVEGVVSGGTAPYEYLWNDANEQTTLTASGLEAGEYTLTVIDANGCQTIESIMITEPAQLTVADAGQDQNFNCGFNATTLSANTPQTGVGTWTIVGTGGTIADVNDPNSGFTAPAGTYTLRWTIAHADGSCANFDEVQITFVEDCSTLDFDGIDDHVNLGDNYAFTTGNFSIEAWIRPKSVNNTRTIFSKRNSKDLSTGFDLIINSGAPTFRWGNRSVSTSHKVTANRWHHIAAIYNNGNISLFVDGIRVGNATATNPTVVNAPALIGAMYNADTPDLPVNYFHGWIEEVRLWGTALNEEQLRFMMNQRLIVNQNPVRGDVLPLDVPGNLDWINLKAYLQMKVTESGNGTTPNLVTNSVDGELKNIETNQENTAPLPYESDQGGTWHDRNSWDSNSTKFWTYPNDTGINGTTIEWNIAKQNHDIDSNNKDIKLLGLFSKTGTQLTMEGVNNNSGNELRITHYLELDGFIDLDGESQLVQTEGSILAENSSGSIERDQQGTENSYNYNYWTSPASPKGTSNNASYTVKGVMKDGTSSKNPQDISFAYAHTHADANYTGNKRISTYWLYKFHGDANSYGHWRYIGHTGELKTGEGFTMKGTSGQALISDQQNYVFNGKPHNGTIALNIFNQENRLVGNPYPSAIDADQFIRDNLRDVDGGTRNQNVFNGALYFWDHFGQENSHVLREYVGGYATYTLAGGVQAASTDSRINATGDTGNKRPGRYIPVAQGFFVNSVIDDAISGNYTIDGGDITFRNRQRVFVKESTANSQFLRPENSEKVKAQVAQAKYTEDTRYKIRLNFYSPKGYHRQILVTADSRTTDQFDLGYDAPLIDNNVEDMFWMMEKSQFVIQGVPHFNLDQKLPIGLKIAEEKEFSIEIGELENLPEIINIYLRDNSDSTYHDLRKEAFKASLPAGEYQDLYEIVFHDVTSTRKDKEPGEGPIDYYYSLENREFVISNPELHKIEHMDIYNIAGQLVDQHFGIPDIKEIHIPQKKSLSSSVYIVKIYTSAGDYAKKVIIRKD